MFGRKEKEQPKKEVPLNYSSWEDDLGFLFLILERKKSMEKRFFINVLSEQLESGDYLNDEMITPKIENIVSEIMEMISGKYEEFLIEKYFKDRNALIRFLTEDTYNDLIQSSILRNNEKIQKKVIENNMGSIQRKNFQ